MEQLLHEPLFWLGLGLGIIILLQAFPWELDMESGEHPVLHTLIDPIGRLKRLLSKNPVQK